MIVQVALTVICMPPAMGIAHEALRDRLIRDAVPGRAYLAVRIDLDRDGCRRLARSRRRPSPPGSSRSTASSNGASRRNRASSRSRLPIACRHGRRRASAEVEVSPASTPVSIPNLWMAAVGPRFFEAFDIPLVAGRDFHDGDRAAGARTVLVNEAFARRYMNGASPVGRRVRYASPDPAKPEPWLEIVGMVRDIGMTPTDLGEAPYVFRAASPGHGVPLVMGVRVVRRPGGAGATACGPSRPSLDPGLRLDELRVARRARLERGRADDGRAPARSPAVVGLGLFLSAAGIFSLMSVSVARRTREIGLRTALGASRARLLARHLLAGGRARRQRRCRRQSRALLFFVTLSTRWTSPTWRTRC